MIDYNGLATRIFVACGTTKQIDLVEMLDVDKATINKWVKGTRFPTLEHIAKVVALKGVAWDWLLTGHGEMFAGSVSATTEKESPASSVTELLSIKAALQQQVAAIDRVIEGMTTVKR